MKIYKLTLAAIFCGALMAVVPRTSAVPTVFSTSDAKADFTFGSGTLTLTLTALEQNPGSAGGLVSGIDFVLNGLSGSGSLTTVNSGNISTIASGGSYSAGTADALTRWQATHSGSTVSLTALTGGQPDHMIIGPDSKGNFDPTLGGKYSAANASVYNFLPVVLGSGTFVLTIPGVTSASQISSVTFLFGTNPDSSETGKLQPTPPTPPAAVPDAASTIALLGVALTGLAGFRAKLLKS